MGVDQLLGRCAACELDSEQFGDLLLAQVLAHAGDLLVGCIRCFAEELDETRARLEVGLHRRSGRWVETEIDVVERAGGDEVLGCDPARLEPFGADGIDQRLGDAFRALLVAADVIDEGVDVLVGLVRVP